MRDCEKGTGYEYDRRLGENFTSVRQIHVEYIRVSVHTRPLGEKKGLVTAKVMEKYQNCVAW